MNITDNLPPWGIIATGDSTVLIARPIEEREAVAYINKHSRGYFESPAIEQLVHEAITPDGNLIMSEIKRGKGTKISLGLGEACLLVMSNQCQISWQMVTRHSLVTPDNRLRDAAKDALSDAEKASNKLSIVAGFLADQLGSSQEATDLVEFLRRHSGSVCTGLRMLAGGSSLHQINEEIFVARGSVAAIEPLSEVEVVEEAPATQETPSEVIP